jgi:hypothetical protein
MCSKSIVFSLFSLKFLTLEMCVWASLNTDLTSSETDSETLDVENRDFSFETMAATRKLQGMFCKAKIHFLFKVFIF